MPPLRGTGAFLVEDSQAEYPRELVDFSQLTLPLELDTQDPLESTQENEEAEDIEDTAEAAANAAAEADSPPITAVANKKKRKRVKFAGMWLKARYSLYLNCQMRHFYA